MSSMLSEPVLMPSIITYILNAASDCIISVTFAIYSDSEPPYSESASPSYLADALSIWSTNSGYPALVMKSLIAFYASGLN